MTEICQTSCQSFIHHLSLTKALIKVTDLAHPFLLPPPPPLPPSILPHQRNDTLLFTLLALLWLTLSNLPCAMRRGRSSAIKSIFHLPIAKRSRLPVLFAAKPPQGSSNHLLYPLPIHFVSTRRPTRNFTVTRTVTKMLTAN